MGLYWRSAVKTGGLAWALSIQGRVSLRSYRDTRVSALVGGGTRITLSPGL